MVVTIVFVLICVGITAKICKMLGCMMSCCSCLARCCCKKGQKVKVVKKHAVSAVRRPETLSIVKSPRSHRKLSELNLLDTPRFQSPRSAETVEYSSLHTSMFGSNGSYLNLNRSAALARREAEVKNQAKRQFEARHKYERLRSVSVGEIGSQSCPLDEHQLSSSMCHIPSAPPQIWVISPKASLRAFPTTSAQLCEIKDINPTELILSPNGGFKYVSLPAHGHPSRQNQHETNMNGMFVPAESQEFQVHGMELGEPTPDSSIVSSPTESGREMITSASYSEPQFGKKPLHLKLPVDIVEPSSILLNPPTIPQRTLSSSPVHQLGRQPRRLAARRVSDGSIFRFDIPPPSFTPLESSGTELNELNPLKQTKEYNGGTPPNSPLILSQVAEQFI